MVISRNYLSEALAKSRSRSSWNDRLAHWEKPASPTEEAQIERAAAMVCDSLAKRPWLNEAGVSVEPQGSYHNNTNVRQTADQDLRAVHKLTRIDYAAGIDAVAAYRAMGLANPGLSFEATMARTRSEIDTALASTFGSLSLDRTGSKAIRVLALPGSRAPVDVVPAFRYIWVMNDGAGGMVRQDGVTILSKDGRWTNNFPRQHHDNGIAKRGRTLHRFKKVVRSLKRLRDELVAAGVLGSKQSPSFLIECLTYVVEDAYFTATGSDERYDRVIQVVERMEELLIQTSWVAVALEINGVKYLFRQGQPWSPADALAFTRAAHARLMVA